MPDKDEKARRKTILHAQREQMRQKFRQTLPTDATTFKALFDYIDRQLESGECDNTLRYTRAFIHDNGLVEDAVIKWLEENGGCCDCEVLANVEELIEEAIPDYHDLK